MIPFNEFWQFCYDFIFNFQSFAQEVWLFLNDEFIIMGESISVLSLCFSLGVGLYLSWVMVKFLVPL